MDLPVSLDAQRRGRNRAGGLTYLARLKPIDQRSPTRCGTAELRHRLATLTPREREAMWLVISGPLNKQIAAELGAGERTLKIHRGLDLIPHLSHRMSRLGIQRSSHR